MAFRRAASSRSGSTVTNTTCTSWPAAPSACLACASVASVTGHTAAQFVKPKASHTSLPRQRDSLKSAPSLPRSSTSGAARGGSKVPALSAASAGKAAVAAAAISTARRDTLTD